MSSFDTPARTYAPGIGDAVADRTINRKMSRAVNAYTKEIEVPRRDDISLDSEIAEYCRSAGLTMSHYVVLNGDDETVKVELTVVAETQTEKWEDVALRVSVGNSLLEPRVGARQAEFARMHHHLRQASILMSGRHLQHGDENQPTRNMEVFTNCSTAAVNFLSFYLMLNGSGVGRCYDDAMMKVDYRNMPKVVPVIDMTHQDVQTGEINCLDRRNAEHLYANKTIHYFEVPDSREGWAKAKEKIELMTFKGIYRDDVLILDFSKVRPRGAPIGGMQDRPASGPGPLIGAIRKMAQLRDAGMAPWRSAMYADHYSAECVLVGGARRAARMATKTWRDDTVLEFVAVKRGGFLWSSNNSVTVDQEFWDSVIKVQALVEKAKAHTLGTPSVALLVKKGAVTPLEKHAYDVFNAVCEAAYHDGTGEPGLITVDKLTWNDEGTDVLLDGDFAESDRYKLEPETLELTRALAEAWKGCRYKVITNPCGEIVLSALGGYCVIADVVPFHAGLAVRSADGEIARSDFQLRNLSEWDDDAEDAFRTATRALIRTNLMNSLYGKEVKRTNRIGVGMTGLHEYAWARFGLGWHDVVSVGKGKVKKMAKMAAQWVGTKSVDIIYWLEQEANCTQDNTYRAAAFWLTLSRFKRAVQDEARKYSAELGVVCPHTNTTMKPAGTTSKLFALTEGSHLPSMREFLRWVQFRNDDPLIAQYAAAGYPVRKLQTYSGTTIVGFPTVPTICSLGMGDKLVTAAEATPEEQYEYLRLLEEFWLTGVEDDCVTPLEERGNQISYTLKYKPSVVSFEEFKRTLLEGQSTIRCCSVMPQTDTSAYEYQPEQPVTKAEFEMIASAIVSAGATMKEEIGREHVDCASGACPIDFNEKAA